MGTTERCASRFLYLLGGCLVLGFAIGLISGYGEQPATVMDAAYAARPEDAGQSGRGHAYGRQVADVLGEAKNKGQDKKAALAELKRRGFKVQDKSDRAAIQARDKRMKAQKAVRDKPMDAKALRKAGESVMKQDKMKKAPEGAKNAARKAHGLEQGGGG